MTATITKQTTITLTTDDLPFDVVLAYEPCDHIDTVVTKTETGYTVAYAINDDGYCGWHPIHDADGLEFEEFRSVTERNEYMDATDPETHVAFIVDHFQHGLSIYSLTSDDRDVWDSRPSCVLRVPVDFADPREAAKAILTEYTSWSNGDIYGVVRMHFDAEGNETEERDECWGFIGTEYTENVVKDPDNYM